MTGTGPTVKRTVFSTSRASEFLELRALQAQTGQHVDAFGDVVVKELLDNALDAAETASREPVIEIATRTDDYREITFVTVTDNGAGITSDIVTRLLDFDRLVSDKARYRSPTRGAQGNAFKTLLGIPYALGVDDPVVIEAAGVRHELRVSVDQVGEVVVTHETTASDRVVGTSVTVPLPADIEVDAQRWAHGAALVNPHATISTINRDLFNDADADENRFLYKSAGQAWSKWTPSMPSSPHWYDRAAFSALVNSHIRTGDAKPLGDFIGEFEGLTSSTKQRIVRVSVPGITHLLGLQDRDDLIAALHQAMRHHAKPTVPKRLGPVGEDHLRTMLDSEYGVHRLWYRADQCIVGGVPWIIEIAVADTAEPGRTWFACNHAPSFGDPLDEVFLDTGDVSAFGAASFLTSADATTGDGGNRAAVVHVICAAPEFTDKGKVALVVPEPVEEAATKALDVVTKTLRKEAEMRRKDAFKAARVVEKARSGQPQDKCSLKDAVAKVMLDAKAAAGDIVGARTLYYKVRPRIQDYTDELLKYDYFSQTLLPAWQREHGALPGLYYEARGSLHHPHDGTVTQLGTREVKDYTLPPWQFDKVLYIEKTGLQAQLAPYQLGPKYDMGIIYGKGYPVVACRDLLARSDFRDMTIFVLHDADIDGYNIARTLGEATGRMPDHNIEIVDLGLTVPQAIEHELEIEQFTRKKELPADLELDDDAREWFTGEAIQGEDGEPVLDKNGKTQYDTTRCELNAFSSDGLAAFIEAGLQRHGVTAKLVPPPEVLTEHVQTVRDEALTEMVWAEIADMVDVDALVRRLVADHPHLADVDEARIRDTFTDDPTQSWRSSAQHLVNADIDATPGFADVLRARLAEQLATPQDHEE